MANSKVTNEYYEYATVDVAPGTDGYYTESINVRRKKVTKIYFSLRGSGVMTVKAQFKCVGDSDWTDYNYGDDFVEGDRILLEGGGAGTQWRAGVANGSYTSGECTFGFDW